MVSCAVPQLVAVVPPQLPPSNQRMSYWPKFAVVIERHMASDATVVTVPEGNIADPRVPPGPKRSTRAAPV